MAKVESNVDVVKAKVKAINSAVNAVEGSSTATFGHFTTTNPNSKMQTTHTEAKLLAASYCDFLRRDLEIVSGLLENSAELDD